MSEDILTNYLEKNEKDYDRFQAFLQRGDWLFNAKVFDDAKECFDQAYIINPTSPEILFRLGIYHYHHREDKEAIDFLRTANRVDPENFQILNNLGAAYGRSGDFKKAINCFRTVCKNDPTQAPAAYNCGRLLLLIGHPKEAERWLTQAAGYRPYHTQTLILLAEARIQIGQPHLAVNISKQAIEQSPENINARRLLAQAYYEGRKIELAYEQLQILLVNEKNDIQGIYLLAKIEEKRGNTNEAGRLYKLLLTLDIPESFKTIIQLKIAMLLPVISKSKNEISQLRDNIINKIDQIKTTSIKDPYASGGFTNFFLAYQGLNDKEIQERIAKFYIQCCPELEKEAPHIQNFKKETKWRFGIVSSYLRNHTVGYLCKGLIEKLDRKKFEVILFRAPLLPAEDPLAPEIAKLANKVIDLPNDLNKSRNILADEKIHILYYPEIGMEDLVYFLAFSRSAPIQAMGWGHPVTSGIPNIDNFLSVNDMEPSIAESHYSEKIIKLKGLSICVKKPILSNNQTNKNKFGMHPNKNAYLCPQSLFKIHPDFDIIVNEVLKKDANGMIYFLTLHTKSDEYFLNRLKQTLGNNINKVKIIERVPSNDFPLLLASADVILDVPHWSGGKTSLEALSVGMPIVHLPGEFMRGRHTLAFYKKINLMDCVVNNVDEYISIAYKIANDDKFNKKIKNKILKSSHKLFDDRKSIDEMSKIFEELIINKYNINK